MSFPKPSQVLRLEWGCSSRAFVVGIRKTHSVLKPWLCFSLYTKDRTFDFVVPSGENEERVLRTFLFSLTALCKNAPRLIATKGAYHIRKVLMKLDEEAKWKGVTRAALLAEALRQSAAAKGLGADEEFPETQGQLSPVVGNGRWRGRI